MTPREKLKLISQLIKKGHNLFKRGKINEAFYLQSLAHQLRRQIETESDYKIILTSHGLRRQQNNLQNEAEKEYLKALKDLTTKD